MTSTPAQSFTIPETEVAQTVGLPLAELRKKRPPQAAARGANGRYLWSPAGVQDLESQLARDGQATGSPPEPPPVAAIKPFVVARVRAPRVLHVVQPGELYDPNHPRCVWLPQPKGDLFIPGMAVLARLREGHLWDFEGNPAAPAKGRRLPRKRGHW